MKFVKPYSEPQRVQRKFSGDTMTEQCHKKDCDINHIVSKYEKTGILTHVRQVEPQYGYAPAVDFLEAMQIVTQAEQEFSALPSGLRARFGNDPANFLEFVNDPNSRDEAVKLGLIRKATESEESPEGISPAAVAPTGKDEHPEPPSRSQTESES